MIISIFIIVLFLGGLILVGKLVLRNVVARNNLGAILHLRKMRWSFARKGRRMMTVGS